MFIQFLKTSKSAMVGLLLVRLYVGWAWLSSGLGKVTGDGFNAAGFLTNTVENPVTSGDGSVAYPLYNALIETIILPNAEMISFIVMWGEVLVGLGLLVGLLTTTAAFFGGVMNVSFLLAGTVSTNPILLLLAILIMVGKGNSGKIGLDYFIKQKKEPEHTEQTIQVIS
ncbi:thiosulfate dehydrogenase [quinone] large subunit [Alkalihalobacillus xiaoxiensis]|uniref:Thiosulfate dehydrogenase [quinone] large subunit n=1 Tax=Shouchella xiaoxiensis TaxID=766895 RepID=A0ABS2SZ44_9BACI|nr:TQO small subunit DoxD [Shouchella xiaoxiensis]MBM7839724.1 thiosulfate dehydrogenase [quinone] large subunit [Shouchella xiaoxiensis]